MNKKRVFSGVQPSGNLHIGNYIGALKQWADNQDRFENIFCIVDLHAITVAQDPDALREKTRETAAWYLASGIDPKKSTVFVQSHNSDHANLGWILNCFTSMGELNRMTQYKDKKSRNDFVSVGLYDYPVLMAADILLYDTDLVPVGHDQKQHVELARDVAERFNGRFGKIFKLPEYMAPPSGERIMSLQHPEKKMSKSEADGLGTINLADSPDEIRKKVRSAVTDSGNEVLAKKDKPAITNLINIFTSVSEKTKEELDEEYSGKGYKKFKEDLAEAIVAHLMPVQERFRELKESEDRLNKVFEEGVKHAHSVSSKKIAEVKKAIGLL